MVTEEDQRRFKESIAPESSLTRTDNFKDPTRYSPGFENSPGSKFKQTVIKPVDVQHLNETKEDLNGTEHLKRTKGNLSGTKHLSGINNLNGTEDLRRTKEHLTKTKGSRVTQKIKGKVTLKEVRHEVVHRQQLAGTKEEDVEPIDEERVSRRR